jgi:beta-glucosidase
MERTGAPAGPLELVERASDRPEDRAPIRRAGAAGPVLLKNDGIQPLAGGGQIAVIGPNAKTAQIMGGGSSQLNPHSRVSPWEGLVAALGAERLSYAEGCDNRRWEPLLAGDFEAEFFASTDLSGPVVHREPMAEAQAFWFGAVGGGKVDPQRYSVRLTGSYTPAASGRYRVGAFAAGLVRVLVDGRLVADAWTGWTPGRTFFEEGCDEVVGTVDLEAGKPVAVTVEFATRPAKLMGFAAFRVGIGLPRGDEAIRAAAETARAAEVALVFVGRNGEWDTEGSDLEDIRLPGRQDELVAAVAAANPRTVVVLQTGGPVEMPWLDAVPGLLEAWYPGQEAGNAIADVLTGAAEPGGRLPQTFPRAWADNPTASRDPEVYPGTDGRVRYAEGVFIGYRHYDRAVVAPLFPFGFGLSYTSFALSAFAAKAEGDGIAVTATVTNTGERAGSTVLQVSVGDPEASVPRPAKELNAFAKLDLAPGEAREVSLALDRRALAFWDEGKHGWTVEPGRFDILGGFSAADLPGRASVTVADGAALAP